MVTWAAIGQTNPLSLTAVLGMRVPEYPPDLDEPKTPKEEAMSLHNLPTTLTPAEHHALSNAVTHLLKERKRQQSEAF